MKHKRNIFACNNVPTDTFTVTGIGKHNESGECIVSYPRLWCSVSGIDHTVSDLYVRFLGGKVGNIQIRKPGRDDRES